MPHEAGPFVLEHSFVSLRATMSVSKRATVDCTHASRYHAPAALEAMAWEELAAHYGRHDLHPHTVPLDTVDQQSQLYCEYRPDSD